MLMPKRTKYRKSQRGKRGGLATRGSQISYGDFGMKALECGWITANQIEAARIAMTRHMKRAGRVWINIFPHKSVTKAAAETRMGKGKGRARSLGRSDQARKNYVSRSPASRRKPPEGHSNLPPVSSRLKHASLIERERPDGVL